MTRYKDECADFIPLSTFLGFVRAEVRKNGWMHVDEGGLCTSDVDWLMYQTWLSCTDARDAVARSTAWQAYASWRAHGARPGERHTPEREAADRPYRPTSEDMELAAEDLKLVKRRLSRSPMPEEWDAGLSAHITRDVAFVAKWGANITEVAYIFVLARDLRIVAAIAAGVTPTIAALGYQAGRCENCGALFPSEAFEKSRLVRHPDGVLLVECPKCGGLQFWILSERTTRNPRAIHPMRRDQQGASGG